VCVSTAHGARAAPPGDDAAPPTSYLTVASTRQWAQALDLFSGFHEVGHQARRGSDGWYENRKTKTGKTTTRTDSGFSEGEGPELSEDVGTVTTMREAWPSFRVYLKTRDMPEWLADRVFVAGGPVFVEALAKAHPDSDESEQTAELRVAPAVAALTTLGYSTPPVQNPRSLLLAPADHGRAALRQAPGIGGRAALAPASEGRGARAGDSRGG